MLAVDYNSAGESNLLRLSPLSLNDQRDETDRPTIEAPTILKERGEERLRINGSRCSSGSGDGCCSLGFPFSIDTTATFAPFAPLLLVRLLGLTLLGLQQTRVESSMSRANVTLLALTGWQAGQRASQRACQRSAQSAAPDLAEWPAKF